MQTQANLKDGQQSNTPARLSRQSALRLLALSRQAERSIDAVLHRSQFVWNALREYYGAERRQLVSAAAAEVGGDGSRSVGNNDRYATDVPRSRLGLLVSSMANRWRQAWSFRENEQGLVAGALSAFLNLLEAAQQPAHEELVELRLRLTSVVGFLEQKLRGAPGLSRIYDVEYFAQPPWQSLHPIAEIFA